MNRTLFSTKLKNVDLFYIQNKERIDALHDNEHLFWEQRLTEWRKYADFCKGLFAEYCSKHPELKSKGEIISAWQNMYQEPDFKARHDVEEQRFNEMCETILKGLE